MASVERRRNKSSSSGDGLKKSLAKSAQSEANITGKAAKPAAKRRSHRKTDAVRLHQAEMLVNLSRRVAALESLDEVLAALVEMIAMELGAERGALFLNDVETGELYSRIAQGNLQREIRFLNTTGVAGWVFTEDEGALIHNAYKDPRFNRNVDQQTGFTTKSILSVPVKTARGEVIGVAQMLNKKKGRFTFDDFDLLEAMTTQAAVALQSTQFIESMEKNREQEMAFLNIVSDLTSELELGALLQKVMAEATRMLNAERSTLFMNDEKTGELFSRVAMGDSLGEIRLPNHLGIAGTVFTSDKTINIPYCYADLRFDPSFDKQTGYFTRSLLCVPLHNKDGDVIGVTQVLNKRGSTFTDEDEQRLKAFTAQISVALENAKLFEDVQTMKNYNESMLESMSNGVITMDEEGTIVTCNVAGMRILQVEAKEILKTKAEEFFSGANAWVMERIEKILETQESEIVMDAELCVDKEVLSVNLTVLPLVSTEEKRLGSMIMIEDISSEKRMKATMSRYMDPGIVDQLLQGDGDILDGSSTKATVLFSDIRGFSTITEELGAQGTVSFLNEYFTIMVECIQDEGGMLDKFIGDAIMAGFGIPVAHDDDEDRAVRAAVRMISEMWRWNEQRLAKGLMPSDMGIGINTDQIVSGNIGSPKRMDFTMIGDGVNVAARLESACKQYSARLLISENTVKKLRGTFRVRNIDDVVVKGKTKPVGVYEVLDFHTEETFPNAMEVVGHFKEGRNHYRGANWNKAIASFKECLNLNPEDKLSQTYIDRCQVLKKRKPKDWQGIWVMTSK